MSIIEAAIYGKIQKLSGDLKPFTPEERKELEECKKQIENYKVQVRKNNKEEFIWHLSLWELCW